MICKGRLHREGGERARCDTSSGGAPAANARGDGQFEIFSAFVRVRGRGDVGCRVDGRAVGEQEGRAAARLRAARLEVEQKSPPATIDELIPVIIAGRVGWVRRLAVKPGADRNRQESCRLRGAQKHQAVRLSRTVDGHRRSAESRRIGAA